MLYRRYADPDTIINKTIKLCFFEQFVNEVVRMYNEEEQERLRWEFFLHKVMDKSYSEFIEDCERGNKKAIPDEQLADIVKQSFDMMQNFTIESR